MKLGTFVQERADPTLEGSNHLLDRVISDNGKIILYNNSYKDKISVVYADIKAFIQGNSDHPDIEFARIDDRKDVVITYQPDKFKRYCRHTEKMQISLVDFDSEETEETKVSCVMCGLEWRN